MKQQEAAYPQLPDNRAIAFMALSMIIMAFSTLFKVFPILVFLGLWLSHAFYKKTFILRPSWDMALALMMPLLFSYSTLWSDFPGPTAYAGIGLTAMICCTIIIARVTGAEAFAKGMVLGATIVLIVTLLNGSYTQDYFTHERSLTGLFKSKNEVGFFSEVCIYAALMLLFRKTKPSEKIIFSLIPILIGAICLYMCKSASSVISLVIACAACLGFYTLSRMQRSVRLIAAIAGVFTLLTLGVFVSAAEVNVFEPVLKVFGKDTTLTGRTYLWSEGIQNGMKRPLIGYGYYAFWKPGRPEAENYWHEFGIPERSGFHFHNLFIQTFVDVGFIGLAMLVTLILVGCYKSIRMAFKTGFSLEQRLALGLSFLFLIRAFVEVDLFGPFGIGPLLYYSIIPRLSRYKK